MTSVSIASQQLPYERVYINTGEPIEDEGLMEFRLLYRGELPGSGKPRDKHEIRRALHPQLRRLWRVKVNLRYYAAWQANMLTSGVISSTSSEQERIKIGLDAIGKQWNRAGFDFIPLATPELSLRCSLDILILRPGESKYIFEQGDLDNQVKVLFDALKLPRDVSETGGAIPQADETPFYCLLEDDRLISEVRVTADELLMLPESKAVGANDAFVIIDVKMNHRNRSWDRWFD